MRERDRKSLLSNVPFLQGLPEDARSSVLTRFEEMSYSFGEIIVREGEPGDAFFILLTGKARVFKQGEDGSEIPLNVVRSGDEFGEIALLEEGVRKATVRCSTEVEALRLKRADFDRLLLEIPSLREFVELRVRHRTLNDFLHQFSELKKLPLPAMTALLRELKPVEAPKGMHIVRDGDPAGPMYIIRHGRARVFKFVEGAEKTLRYLRAGDFFGELSIIKGSARTATVEAVTDCELLALEPAVFTSLMERHSELRRVIDERIAIYDHETEARVPLDFRVSVLPADASVHNKVELDEEAREPEELSQVEDVAKAKRSKRDKEPFETEEGLFRKRRRIRRFPFVQQIDEMDCGPACLAMISRHFRLRPTLPRIRQLCHTAHDGTSLKALCHAATELGMAARSVKVSRRRLDQVPLPAILHWEGNHWVVLVGVSKRKVRIADPSMGLRSLPRAKLDEKWSGYAALFDYAGEPDRSERSRGSLGWLWPFVKPYMGVFFQVLSLAVVASGLQMLMPIFTQVIVDRVVVEHDVSLLNTVIIAMGVAFFFMILATSLHPYMASFVAIRVDAAVLDFLTRRLLSLPMSYFNSRRVGDIQRRLDGAREVREFVVQQGIGGLLSVVQVAASLTLMAIYSGTLLLVFLATIPLYFGFMGFSAKFLKPLFAELEERHGKYSSHQIDAIKGIEAVKAASAEHALRDTMLNEFLRLANQQFRSGVLILGYDSAIHAVGFLSNLLFLWVGAHLVITGEMTVGGFVAFNALIAMAQAPIMRILGLWDELQLSSVLLNRLRDVFESEPEQGEERDRLIPVRSLEGRVELVNVSFRYGGPESPEILHGISLEVPAGKTIAIVGRSGCGKTTLIKCLSGMLEPTVGTILYDGIDMKTLNHRDLRRQIGMVLQENYMFDGTVSQNIAFGDAEPDPDHVSWASRIADAEEFIARLPLGYETRIGETGLALSGGQRQRIAIARALYENPPIIVMDEATSALDTASERAIQENVGRLLEERTAFVIAHRLSTVRNADVIVVLEKGRVAERGTHDELMVRRGLYFFMCSQQMGS